MDDNNRFEENNENESRQKFDEVQQKFEEAQQKIENAVDDKISEVVDKAEKATGVDITVTDGGSGLATGSLVCGIISVMCWFFGWSTIASIILGIIGIVLASRSKANGFSGGTRTAGFILSIIGLVGGAFLFVSCIACVGCLGAMAQ